MEIRSKAEMYGLYERGLFGNRLLTWRDLSEFQRSGYMRNVVMRYKGKGGGAWCSYDVPPCQVFDVARQWESESADINLITLNELAEDHRMVLQGEVMRSQDYLSLRFTTVKKPMRKALEECQQHASGLVALSWLQTHLYPNSYDDLITLLDEYDGAVIEFSAYDKPVGDCPRRNTIFWEVRHY